MGRILVIGGTGNMGRPLVKLLAESGHCVSVVCRRKVCEGDAARLANCGGEYFYGDAKDGKFMDGVLNRHFDAIVDFCIYSSEEFRERVSTFLAKTDQYVCLSAGAVYADIPTPKNESSPRYLEADPPQEGTAKWNWYCYEKARIEDMLLKSGKRNWTIVRPGSIMNASHYGWGHWWNEDWTWRILRGQKVIVVEDMLDYRFSFSSGEQIAGMMAVLVCNGKTMGEVYNVCSDEVWTWRGLLEAYVEIFAKHGIEIRCVSRNSKDIIGTNAGFEYWYKRARLLDRVFDNSKIKVLLPQMALKQCMRSVLEDWVAESVPSYPLITSNRIWHVAGVDRMAGGFSVPKMFSEGWHDYPKYLVMRCSPRLWNWLFYR